MLVNKKALLSTIDICGNRDKFESMVEWGMEPGDAINMGDSEYLWQRDIISKRSMRAIDNDDDNVYQRVLHEIGVILGIR